MQIKAKEERKLGTAKKLARTAKKLAKCKKPNIAKDYKRKKPKIAKTRNAKKKLEMQNT